MTKTGTPGIVSKDRATTTDSGMIKVCIIEDHAIVRAGLRMLIENSPRMSVLWETQTASEALSNPDLEHPQVILLDLDLGIERGLDLLPSLLEKFSPARILILTALADTQQHLAAVASGASGVVLKEQAPETLIQAIESVYSGEAWLGKSLMSAVMGKLSQDVFGQAGSGSGEDLPSDTPRSRNRGPGQRRAQRGANRETVTDL